MTAQELKNSVLQLAVQGKLVPQCKDDEPASELTRQIIERRNQIEKNHIKTLSSISEEEISFEIPESWIWLRLGDFCQIYNGNSINANVKQEKYSRKCDGYSFIATKDLGFDHVINYDNGIYIPKAEPDFRIAVSGSILLCMEGGSAGKKIGILTRDVCFGNKLCCFTPYIIDSQYLYYYLQSPMFFSDFFGSMTGLIGGVGSAKLKNLLCAIPPLSEQKRIVEKIEELMSLIEEYGKAEEQLSKLNAEFPDKLRKSILQQAVQGRLVSQDPNDEPASELFKRICAEKSKMIAEGKNKKGNTVLEIDEDEIPFEIPESWVWVRFLSVVDIKANLVSPSEYLKYLHIAPDNIEKSTGRLLECRTVEEDKVASANHLFFEGQIIYSKIRPLLRKAVIAPFKGLCSADMYPLDTYLENKYVLYYLLSDACNKQISKIIANRVKMPKINQNELSKVLFPLPPLTEQKRIVKRVEELLAMCDELKGE